MGTEIVISVSYGFALWSFHSTIVRFYRTIVSKKRPDI